MVDSVKERKSKLGPLNPKKSDEGENDNDVNDYDDYDDEEDDVDGDDTSVNEPVGRPVAICTSQVFCDHLIDIGYGFRFKRCSLSYVQRHV